MATNQDRFNLRVDTFVMLLSFLGAAAVGYPLLGYRNPPAYGMVVASMILVIVAFAVLARGMRHLFRGSRLMFQGKPASPDISMALLVFFESLTVSIVTYPIHHHTSERGFWWHYPLTVVVITGVAGTVVALGYALKLWANSKLRR